MLGCFQNQIDKRILILPDLSIYQFIVWQKQCDVKQNFKFTVECVHYLAKQQTWVISFIIFTWRLQNTLAPHSSEQYQASLWEEKKTHTSGILMNYCNELCKIMHAIRVLLNKPFEHQIIGLNFMARFRGSNHFRTPHPHSVGLVLKSHYFFVNTPLIKCVLRLQGSQFLSSNCAVVRISARMQSNLQTSVTFGL